MDTRILLHDQAPLVVKINTLVKRLLSISPYATQRFLPISGKGLITVFRFSFRI